MQYQLPPSFINSLTALVIALDHNPVGGAYLLALAVMFMLSLAYSRK